MNVEELPRSDKKKYIEQHVAVYAELLTDDELDNLFMVLEATISVNSKGAHR